MTELKPCPFCGSWVRIYTRYDSCNGSSESGEWAACIKCPDCDSVSQQVSECTTEQDALEAVVELWNTRAEWTCTLIESEGHHETEGRGWHCSECGYEFDEYQKATANYCQSCGAKVVG